MTRNTEHTEISESALLVACRDRFRTRVLDQLRRMHELWGDDPLMANHLRGVKTFAVNLLTDLPHTDRHEAERIVEDALHSCLNPIS